MSLARWPLRDDVEPAANSLLQQTESFIFTDSVPDDGKEPRNKYHRKEPNADTEPHPISHITRDVDIDTHDHPISHSNPHLNGNADGYAFAPFGHQVDAETILSRQRGDNRANAVSWRQL